MAKAKGNTRLPQRTVRIRIPLSDIGPDPIQYKPYNPHFHPSNIFVIVDVPISEIVATEGTKKSPVYTITQRGVALICKQIATSIAGVYSERD